MYKDYRKKIKSETDLQYNILVLLNALPRCFAWNNHGNAKVKNVSDVTGVIQSTYFVFEVKLPGKESTATTGQKNFIRKVKECGGLTGIVSSIYEVCDKISNFLYPIRPQGLWDIEGAISKELERYERSRT